MKKISKIVALLLLATSLTLRPEPISSDRENRTEEEIQQILENKQLELVKQHDPIIQAMAPIKTIGSKLSRASWICWIAGGLLKLSGTDSTLYTISYPLFGIGCGTSLMASGISSLRSESLSKNPSIFLSGFNLALALWGAKMAQNNFNQTENVIKPLMMAGFLS